VVCSDRWRTAARSYMNLIPKPKSLPFIIHLDAKEVARLPVTGKIARDGPNLSSSKTFWNWLRMIKAEWEHLTVRLGAK